MSTTKWTRHNTPWTPGRDAEASRLWREGVSAAQIVKALACGVTRNSVIGRLHRMGVVSGAPKHGNCGRGSRVAGGLGPVRIAPRPRPLPIPKPVKPGPWVELEPTASFDQLGPHMCRWPIGEPGTPGFAFCGRLCGKRADGSVKTYCTHHGTRAYLPKKKPLGNAFAKWVTR